MKQVEPQPGSAADRQLDLVWVTVGLQFDEVRIVSSTVCESAWVGFVFPECICKWAYKGRYLFSPQYNQKSIERLPEWESRLLGSCPMVVTC